MSWFLNSPFCYFWYGVELILITKINTAYLCNIMYVCICLYYECSCNISLGSITGVLAIGIKQIKSKWSVTIYWKSAEIEST